MDNLKASVVQPWKKYHREAPIRNFKVEQKFCELLFEANKNNLDKKAINYMGLTGNDWTFKELFLQADKLASAYKMAGLKDGDTVLIATVSGIEEALNLIALNKIGVVSKWIDITAAEEDLLEAIEADDCKFVVCFAAVIPAINNIIDKTGLEKVLYVEPSQFIRKSQILRFGIKGMKELGNLKKQSEKRPLPEMPNDSRYISFVEFMNQGDSHVEIVPYEKIDLF